MLIILILVILICWFVFSYNGLVAKKQRVKEASSDILVQLKRRFDLIPNLVETVKGYTKHEAETLEKITEMRSKINDSKNIIETDKINKEISKDIKNFLVSVEAYPELKANENFLQLQKELADTENKIQASRRFYNNIVKEYNIAIHSIPTNLVASLLKYTEEPLLDISEEEKESIQVRF